MAYWFMKQGRGQVLDHEDRPQAGHASQGAAAQGPLQPCPHRGVAELTLQPLLCGQDRMTDRGSEGQPKPAGFALSDLCDSSPLSPALLRLLLSFPFFKHTCSKKFPLPPAPLCPSCLLGCHNSLPSSKPSSQG